MSKTDFYCQCTLRKHLHHNHCLEQVSYIPQQFAELSNCIKLRDENGVWVDGWIIVRVGEPREAKLVENEERTYTRTRKTSDI